MHEPAVTLPVDRLAEVWPVRLRDKKLRLGALLHPASVNARLETTLSVLERHHGELFALSALFGPQHGFGGTTQDNMIEWESFPHPRLGCPVFSLYGEHREPTPAMLDTIDVLLVDLQDVGSRYYTFVWTLYLCLRACAARGIPVVVCDRPNPLNGVAVEGTPQLPDYLSFVGLHPLPVRHAMTMGEMAAKFRDEVIPGVDLQVLPMEGWRRDMWFDETGLPWVMPSPNMPTLDTATVYPGMCLFEGTNVSEGRGTTRPFEIFGAPWIDAERLCAALKERELPGVLFREWCFEPTFQKHARNLCQGAHLHVTDRDRFEPWRTGLEILRTIRGLWPRHFEWKEPPYEYEYEKLPIEILLGAPLETFFVTEGDGGRA